MTPLRNEGRFFCPKGVEITPNLDLLNKTSVIFISFYGIYRVAQKMRDHAYLWLNCHKTRSTNQKP